MVNCVDIVGFDLVVVCLRHHIVFWIVFVYKRGLCLHCLYLVVVLFDCWVALLDFIDLIWIALVYLLIRLLGVISIVLLSTLFMLLSLFVLYWFWVCLLIWILLNWYAAYFAVFVGLCGHLLLVLRVAIVGFVCWLVACVLICLNILLVLCCWLCYSLYIACFKLFLLRIVWCDLVLPLWFGF